MSLNCPWAVCIPWLHQGYYKIHCTPGMQVWVPCAWFIPCLRYFCFSLSVDLLRVHWWNLFVPLAPSDFWPGLCTVLYHSTPMPGKGLCRELLLHIAWLICLLWATFYQSVIPCHRLTSIGGWPSMRVTSWIVFLPHWGHVDHLFTPRGNCRYLVNFSSGLLVIWHPWLMPMLLQGQTGCQHSVVRGTWAVEGVMSRL